MTTTLTIAIPVYNGEKDIQRLLDSIYNQNYDPKKLEVLISDNCSTDKTESLVSIYKSRDLKYYKNDQNIGADRNIAKCIELSSSPYTWIIGHDDYITNESIKEIIEILEIKKPHSIFINYSLVSEKDTYLKKEWITDKKSNLYTDLNSFISDVGISINFLSAIVHNTKSFLKSNYTHYYGTNWVQLGTFLEYSRTNSSIFFQSRPFIINAGNSESGEGNINGKSLRILINLFEVFDQNMDKSSLTARRKVIKDFNKYSLKKLISTKRLGYTVDSQIIRKIKTILPLYTLILFYTINSVPNSIIQLLYRSSLGDQIKSLVWKKL